MEKLRMVSGGVIGENGTTWGYGKERGKVRSCRV